MSKVLLIRVEDICTETGINYNSCKMFLRKYKNKQGMHFKRLKKFMDTNCPLFRVLSKDEDLVDVKQYPKCSLYISKDNEAIRVIGSNYLDKLDITKEQERIT